MITQYNYLDSDYDSELAKASIQEAKVYQKFWYGDFYALTGAQIGNDQCTAWQLNRGDLGAGLVYIFRQEECPYTGVEMTLRAIDLNANYRVTIKTGYDDGVTKTMTGEELRNIVVPLTKRRTAVVVEYLKIP